MNQDLKKENNKNVFFIMTASLTCSVMIQLDVVSGVGLIDVAIVGSEGVLLSVVLVLLSNLLPADIKQKLVFMRLKNELPACRVHILCKKDPRLEYESVVSRWPEVFDSEIDEATRNSKWYQLIYKAVKDKEEVRQSHRSFLLYRDAFSGLFLIFLITVGSFFVGEIPVIGQIKPSVILLQAIFSLLALTAANVAGKRFVINVVAAA